MTQEQWHDMLECRGIYPPSAACEKCSGYGVICYGSTATWRGGVGGAAMTPDVCNKCWGSGNAERPWPSWRNK